MNLSGRCSCGAVTYEISNEPLFTQACHCTDCQPGRDAHLVTCSFRHHQNAAGPGADKIIPVSLCESKGKTHIRQRNQGLF